MVYINSPLIILYSVLAVVLFFIDNVTGNALGSILILHSQFDTCSITDYISLFTYTLGHADINHLMGNFSFILLLGPILEEKYGFWRLLMMMIFTAVITGIINLIISPNGLLGASGIVFMFIILTSVANRKKGKVPITLIAVVLLYLGREVMHLFQPNNVSELAHIIGGILGGVIGLFNLFGSKKETSVV